jgi:hypothetical protein
LAITYPSRSISATDWLLSIALGGGCIPILSDVSNEILILGHVFTGTLTTQVATFNYNKDQIGQQNDAGSCGKGLFGVDLYVPNTDVNAMTA